ncbi:MAG: GTPase HflX [Treponema sp.]|nr:GTPase HflX [Treponema sp.]
MVEIQEEQEKKVRCLLIGAPSKQKGVAEEPEELKGLVSTLGMEISGIKVLTRIEPNPAYGIGKGKTQEIADMAKETFSDCIIFDWEIDPTKQRNWEKLTNIPVFDRNEVIIRIFAQRAQTKEAVLQVNLARLTYSLPRLSHTYGDLARQRGGSYGAKGSGETQLELDRRQIEDKIIQIKKELDQIIINRQVQRKQRERTSTPSCALVGYTNAGKSSLLNALTGADAFVEDKLFATLDPTTRKLSLAEGSFILLTDTVGFISNLPHTLIDSFKSTLEETTFADLLLITVDASDPNCKEQYGQVISVLEEIKADRIPRLILLNKYDKVSKDELLEAELDAFFPDAIKISAKTKEGFDTLILQITERLLGTQAKFKIPMEQNQLVELARKNGTIINEDWQEDCIMLDARIPGTVDKNGNATTRTLAMLMKYLIG